VVGCVLLNDLSIPHDSYYRPPVKFKCLDGFLGIGPRCVPLAEVGDINALTLEVRINGELRQTVDFSWPGARCRHAAAPTSTPS
jgi:5-oxopent-3-ene-1,2,5-tricarboxylate decarboxylase/2-hydroxyhepta-2,4-diene-1,7-dioate isomerase